MVVGSLVTYATVKAYSLKGKLLSKKLFQTLAESRNLDEFASRLNSTSYSDYIRKIPKPYTSNNIEISFRGKQAELYYMMMNSVGGSNLLMAYYYKFIFKNLKNILKGKILGKTQSQIESTIGLRAEELIQRREKRPWRARDARLRRDRARRSRREARARARSLNFRVCRRSGIR